MGVLCPTRRLLACIGSPMTVFTRFWRHAHDACLFRPLMPRGALQPLLDVLMFSRSLARIMGWKGQFVLYAYYLASALGLRAMSPPLALITAQETGLSGAFRAAHQVNAVWSCLCRELACCKHLQTDYSQSAVVSSARCIAAGLCTRHLEN